MRSQPALILLIIALIQACSDPAPVKDVQDLAPPDMAAEMADALDESPDHAPDLVEEMGAFVVDAGAARYALVDEEVVLDGSGSRGAERFLWDFGDGRRQEVASADPVARVRYAAPGRYQATLTAYDVNGRRRTARALISVTRAAVYQPQAASSVAILPGASSAAYRIAALSEDGGAVSIFEHVDGAMRLHRRTGRLCERPRTLAARGELIAVACQGSDALVVIDQDGAEQARLNFGAGARPYGVVWTDDGLFATLQGVGKLARVGFVAGRLEELARHDAVEDARALAALADGRLVVSRWRSSDVVGEGELVVVDGASGAREAWRLPLDPQRASDTEIGGLPSYLNQIAADPTGQLIVVASTQANVRDGLARSGDATEHDTMLRAVLSWADVSSGAPAGARTQLDNRGMASAAVFNSRGDYLYAATRGARTIERIDVLASRAAVGTVFDVGYAPEGLALSPDEALLFVDASLSRELVVIDVRDWRVVPQVVARLPLVDEEPLPAQVFSGKRLFNDGADPRLAKDNYLACAHCHMEGDHDGRTWDFTQRGEGLRNTISLIGRAGMADGPVHWSANFDELQDFEADIRLHAGGAGLMDDAAWMETSASLGATKAGRSAALDDLAAYMTSLNVEPPSPYREADGSLPPAAARGKLLFESAGLGCATCHAGARLTDSGVGGLHDVGTLGVGSGMRLGEALVGLDTPTLHGLFRSAPYLHDGSAATLREVLVERNAAGRHGVTAGLDAGQIDDLVAYLRCLDGRR